MRTAVASLPRSVTPPNRAVTSQQRPAPSGTHPPPTALGTPQPGGAWLQGLGSSAVGRCISLVELPVGTKSVFDGRWMFLLPRPIDTRKKKSLK